jgi:signal peptide peptidase SppA
MRYANIIRAFADTVWALAPEKLAAIADFLAIKAQGGFVPAFAPEKASACDGAAADVQQTGGAVAVLSVVGIFSSRMSLMENISSRGISAKKVGDAIDSLADNPEISAIVLDIESPGGAAIGIAELADRVFAAREKKPVIAHTLYAASGAYWMAAAAEKLFVARSGEVGSIGVYAVYVDESAKNEKEGIKYSIISAGPYKTEGNPYEAMTDEAKAAVQAKIDIRYRQFISDVARGRGKTADEVARNFGGGRMVLAQEAVESGMADGIMTLAQTIEYAAAAAKKRHELKQWRTNKAKALGLGT